jgi:hypothetical protein
VTPLAGHCPSVVSAATISTKRTRPGREADHVRLIRTREPKKAGVPVSAFKVEVSLSLSQPGATKRHERFGRAEFALRAAAIRVHEMNNSPPAATPICMTAAACNEP